jgi:hypothetical protein
VKGDRQANREVVRFSVGHHFRKPIQWVVINKTVDKTVRMKANVAWCTYTSEPPPRISGVRVVERPRKVYMTAFLPHQPTHGCLAVAVLVNYTVTLRHELGGRQLFDASQKPPVKRWPRSQAK